MGEMGGAGPQADEEALEVILCDAGASRGDARITGAEGEGDFRRPEGGRDGAFRFVAVGGEVDAHRSPRRLPPKIGGYALAEGGNGGAGASSRP